MNRFLASAVAAMAFALGGVAAADFQCGNLVFINGAAGPEFGGTTWGTWADQGLHELCATTTYFDSLFGPDFTVIVTSEVLGPGLLTMSFDFSGFFPGDFSFHSINIGGLKEDGTIVEVGANVGFAITDGNNVHWEGTGAELASVGTLKLLIQQIPAPGAFALLGMAGLVARRRRG